MKKLHKWENDFNFLPALYIVYKKLGQLFSILYFLTYLNKNILVALQVINIWTS